MDKIDRKTFRSLGELMTESATKPFDYRSMAIASANVATCFRALHARGLAYRDINRDNVLINHANGDVRICDNDNVGVSGEDTISVVGTFEYMAPRVDTCSEDCTVTANRLIFFSGLLVLPMDVASSTGRKIRGTGSCLG